MRRLALLLAAISVTFAVNASAAHADWRFERVQEIAYSVWGAKLRTACPNGAPLDMRTTAGAAGVVEEAAGWVDPGRCVVHVARHPKWMHLDDFEPFCTTYLHETGHLAGYGHTRSGIMEAMPVWSREVARIAGARRTAVRWTGTDSRCRARGRPYMERMHLL